MYYFIFKRPNNTYYFKIKGQVYFYSHPEGYKNQYGHEVVLVISIPKSLYRRVHPLKYFKKVVLKSIIRLLDKIIKRMD